MTVSPATAMVQVGSWDQSHDPVVLVVPDLDEKNYFKFAWIQAIGQVLLKDEAIDFVVYRQTVRLGTAQGFPGCLQSAAMLHRF